MCDFGCLSDPKFFQLGFGSSLQPWDVWRPTGMHWALSLGASTFCSLIPHSFSSLGVISLSCLINWDCSLHAGFGDSHQIARTGFYSNSLTSCHPTIKKAFNCFFSSHSMSALGGLCSSCQPICSSQRVGIGSVASSDSVCTLAGPGYLLISENKSQNLPHPDQFPSEMVRVLPIVYGGSLEIILKHHFSCNS